MIAAVISVAEKRVAPVLIVWTVSMSMTTQGWRPSCLGASHLQYPERW